MKPLFFIFFLTLWANIGFSQHENLQRTSQSDLFVERYTSLNYFQRRDLAVEKANELKRGTLVVRLDAKKNKIDKLNELRRTKEATIIRKQREDYNKDLVEKFKYYYTFSDVLFVYGYMLPDFIDGKITDIYLNENLEIDPSIKPKDGPIFYYGGQSTDLFYLLDDGFGVLEPPAPYAVYTGKGDKLGGTGQGFFGARYHASRGVEYLNKRLLKLAGF